MKLALWLWPHEAWRWQERPHWGGARAGLLTHSPFPPAATSHPLCAEPQLHAFSERLLQAGARPGSGAHEHLTLPIPLSKARAAAGPPGWASGHNCSFTPFSNSRFPGSLRASSVIRHGSASRTCRRSHGCSRMVQGQVRPCSTQGRQAVPSREKTEWLLALSTQVWSRHSGISSFCELLECWGPGRLGPTWLTAEPSLGS